jgi:pimeloyl-ACP methyl ester carboxylesterase
VSNPLGVASRAHLQRSRFALRSRVVIDARFRQAARHRLGPDRDVQNEQLAALSPQGSLIVAQGSGHDVQLDRPETVIEAARRMAAAVEAKQ